MDMKINYKMLKSSQIASIINEIYDGVERSKVGIICKEKIEEDGTKKLEVGHIPFQTYLTILAALFPKNFFGDMKMTEENNG